MTGVRGDHFANLDPGAGKRAQRGVATSQAASRPRIHDQQDALDQRRQILKKSSPTCFFDVLNPRSPSPQTSLSNEGS